MKATTIFFALALITTATIASANPNQRTLTFRDAFGRILEQPVQEETVYDSIPFDVQAEFARIRQEQTSQVFDLAEMSKPEEADPLPYFVKNLLTPEKADPLPYFVINLRSEARVNK